MKPGDPHLHEPNDVQLAIQIVEEDVACTQTNGRGVAEAPASRETKSMLVATHCLMKPSIYERFQF